MMIELKEIFKKRDESDKKFMNEIFDSISNVLAACNEFIKEQSENFKHVEWDGISFIKEEDALLLMGTVAYNAGDTIILPNGEKVIISEDNAEYFKILLRFVLPYELATIGSSHEIYKFISETVEISDNVNNEENENNDFPETMYADGHKPLDGFDLNDLSDEQQKTMAMFLTAENLKENEN